MNIKYRLIMIPMLAAGLSLASCSTSSKDTKTYTEFSEDDPRIGEEVKRVCKGNGINGFGETTRNTVVVSTSVNTRHLLKVSGGCFNLQHAGSISVNSRTSCLERGDSLLAFEDTFGPQQGDMRPIKCFITNIYEYDMDALDKAEAGDVIDPATKTNNNS